MHFRFFRLSTSSDTVLLTATALLLLHFHSMTLHCYYTWEARNCIVVPSKNLGPNPFCIWWRCQPALTENSGAFFGANLRSCIKVGLQTCHIIYINQIMQVHAKILCLIFHDLSVHWKAFATVTSLSHETARCACTEKALDATSRSVHSAKASRQWLQCGSNWKRRGNGPWQIGDLVGHKVNTKLRSRGSCSTKKPQDQSQDQNTWPASISFSESKVGSRTAAWTLESTVWIASTKTSRTRQRDLW